MARPNYAMLEVGKTGIRRNYNTVDEEFLSTLKSAEGIRTYREMRDNDPIIGAFMHAITMIFREARWSVQIPANGGSEKDKNFLLDCMYDMQFSWSDFIADAVSMLTYGWSWFEQVYKRRQDGKIGWKKFAFRSQTSLEEWSFTDVGDTIGMYQRPAPDYTSYYLPLSKSIHFRTENAGGNPEGRSVLRNSYRPWFFKKVIEELEGIGLERDFTGLPKINLPPGINLADDDPETQAAVTAAKRLIANVRRDEQDGILLPDGWLFELVSSPGQRQFNTVEIINRYNKEIAVTVLAQFIMLGMERTGSYALAGEQTEMFYLCLEGWMDNMASTINRQAVRLLFGLNGREDYQNFPSVVHTLVRKVNLKDMTNYISQLVPIDAVEVTDDLKSFLKSYARLSEYSERKE